MSEQLLHRFIYMTVGGQFISVFVYFHSLTVESPVKRSLLLIGSSLTSVDVLLALWPLNIKHLLQLMFNFLLNRWLFQVNDTSWDFIIHKQSWSTYSWDNITVLPYFTEICVFLLLRAFGDQMYNIKNWFKNIPSQAWKSKPVW